MIDAYPLDFTPLSLDPGYMQLQREIERAVTAQVERERDQHEAVFLQSLFDPWLRGVLVDEHGVAALSAEVPEGEVHYMPRAFPSLLDLR